MKLYLDIDGVLLTPKQKQIAEDAPAFIAFVTENFDCFWLTTHCKGDNAPAIKYLSKYFDNETIEILQKVKPSDWSTLKSEAIDFRSAFIWIDDFPLQAEMRVMNEHLRTDSVIVVDLNRTGELKRIISILEKAKSKI